MCLGYTTAALPIPEPNNGGQTSEDPTPPAKQADQEDEAAIREFVHPDMKVEPLFYDVKAQDLYFVVCLGLLKVSSHRSMACLSKTKLTGQNYCCILCSGLAVYCNYNKQLISACSCIFISTNRHMCTNVFHVSGGIYEVYRHNLNACMCKARHVFYVL